MNAKTRKAQAMPEYGARSLNYVGIKTLFEASWFHQTNTVGGMCATANPIPAPCRKFEREQTELRDQYYTILERHGHTKANAACLWQRLIDVASDAATSHFFHETGLNANDWVIVADNAQNRQAAHNAANVGIAEIVKQIKLASGDINNVHIPPTTPNLFGLQEASGDVEGCGWVYLFRNVGDGTVKIGKTKNHPSQRMSEGKTWAKLELVFAALLSNYSQVERSLHKQLESLNARREFFKLSEDDIKQVITYLQPMAVKVITN